jgi:hypothetical protein
MTPHDCSRFDTCNAPVCPVDDAWPKAVHLPGERVCPYLLNSGKEGAAEWHAGDPVFQVCLDRLPAICEKHSIIAKAMAKASLSGFKGAHLKGRSWGRRPDREKLVLVAVGLLFVSRR